MIISPLTAYFSTLTPTTAYTVMLPEPRINLEAPKTIAAQRNISGGASISVFASNIAGKVVEIDLVVSAEQKTTLQRIKNSGVNEWFLRIAGRRFEIVYDLVSAIREPETLDKWRCIIQITFVSEV